MSRFTIECRCGEQFHLTSESVGRRIRCRCGRELKVRRRTSPRTSAARSGAPVERRDSPAHKPAGAPPALATLFARWLAIASWAYLVTVCLIAVVMWSLGDRWWLGTILLFIGRWIFLLPLVALVPGAVMLVALVPGAVIAARRALVPLAIAALVVIWPVMGARTGWRLLSSAPLGTQVRVVSFNVHGGARLAGDMRRILDEMNPDVLAIQECGTKLASSLAELKGWQHHDAERLCLLSRYPIRRASVMDRSVLKTINRASHLGGGSAAVRYSIDTPGGPIELTNVHLETPRKGLKGAPRLHSSFKIDALRANTAFREIESDLARRWVDADVAESGVPFVVAGDFNTPVESRIFQQHWGDLTNAFSHAGIGFGMTRYNGWIRVRIDHVLIGPGWHADRSVVGDDYGSDHRPVIADITLRDGSE
jgi:endonuclease/exonuclease/phosphatase (EEP) superfamily protein YafD